MESCLQTAVISAFELMCFTALEPAVEDTECSDGILRGEVEFEGDAVGRLRLEMPVIAARSIAADFYSAEPDMPQNQVEAVVGEMANVICGSMLSTYAPEGGFCLSTPEVGVGPAERYPVRRCFHMESGPVIVSLACKSSSPHPR
ncbi:MAG TPA: chemotaxis protein CheX [Bryobacteraceae bacterium]|nr:chemotaxis protein CheX [Bryobacteraceae bacterium]